MTENILLLPNKWVTEALLITLTGLKPGTIRNARDKSWMEGREYKHVSPDGQPKSNSFCMYNREAIDRWVEKNPKAIARAENKQKTA